MAQAEDTVGKKPLTSETEKRRKTPKWVKGLGDHPASQGVICFFIACYIALVNLTTRWTYVRPEIPQEYFAHQKPVIYCFWHGRLLMIPFGWRTKMKLRVLISHHRDGKIIARAVSYYGVHSIHGSSAAKDGNKDKGGAAALRSMVKAVRAGDGVGITPDGPSGPYMRASDGVVALAKLTGVPIIPVTYSTTRRRILNTWDRFCWPKPFAQGVFAYGEMIVVDRKASQEELEEVKQLVEDRLNMLTREVDELCGHEPLEPARLDPS